MVRKHKRRFLTREEIEEATPDELAEHFMPLAQRMASKWHPGCEDTLSDAYVGLVIAAQKYSPAKGPFAAWAALWIKQSLGRGTSGQRDLIYVPSAVRKGRAEVLSVKEFLRREQPSTSITAQDIAHHLGGDWTARKVQRMLDVPSTHSYHNLPPDTDIDHLGELYDESSELSFRAVDYRAELDELIVEHDLPREVVRTMSKWLASPKSDDDLKQIAKSIQEHVGSEL